MSMNSYLVDRQRDEWFGGVHTDGLVNWKQTRQEAFALEGGLVGPMMGRLVARIYPERAAHLTLVPADVPADKPELVSELSEAQWAMPVVRLETVQLKALMAAVLYHDEESTRDASGATNAAQWILDQVERGR